MLTPLLNCHHYNSKECVCYLFTDATLSWSESLWVHHKEQDTLFLHRGGILRIHSTTTKMFFGRWEKSWRTCRDAEFEPQSPEMQSIFWLHVKLVINTNHFIVFFHYLIYLMNTLQNDLKCLTVTLQSYCPNCWIFLDLRIIYIIMLQEICYQQCSPPSR